MGEKREMTVLEVLAETMNILSNLKIPAVLASEIGVPVEGCIKNLHLCYEALSQKQTKEIQDTLNEMEGKTDEREADV